ncbi:MAG: carboxypeptidase-like regulatory domain-containing protein, partial [Gammaproteobacteria bacterium]
MNRSSTLRVSQFLNVAAAAAILLAHVAYAESLTGKVVASDGQPIRGAAVIALGTSSIPWTSFRTPADAAGGFAFNTLTPGSYRLCVEVAAGGYLNPCQWSA